MTRNSFLLILLFGLTVSLALGADVSGQWTAQVPGRGGNMMDYTFTFKADGAKLTGSVTTQFGETPIENGKVSGDEISFEQNLEFGGNAMKFLYKGKVAGNEIQFTRAREGGEPREFTAKRK